MVSLELVHKPVVQKSIEKERIESKEIGLNTFNWKITKLGHKLMVTHKLQPYVIFSYYSVYNIQLEDTFKEYRLLYIYFILSLW